MGGKINLIIGIITTLIFFWIDSMLIWLSLGTTILIFWSFGVIHNFAMNSARERRKLIIENKGHEGASPEEIERVKNLPIHISSGDLNIVPNWLTTLNMIFSLAIYVLLIVAIIKVIL
jgi:hypothetical protein